MQTNPRPSSANIGSGQISLRGQNLSGSTFRDEIPGNSNAGEAHDYVDLSMVKRVEVSMRLSARWKF